MSYTPDFDFNTRFTMWFDFMFFQTFVIHIKDLVIWAFDRSLRNENPGVKGSHEVVRTWQMIVGYLWVYAWWYWIDPRTMDPLIRLKFTTTNPLQFSIIRPMLRLTSLESK